MAPGPLPPHGITLAGARVVLRPMTEEDWNVLLRWHQDPEVLYYAEGDDVLSHTVEEVRQIYRSVAQSALLFIIEQDGEPVGECWLQRMNLERVLSRYPGHDLRRIDLMIGEKRLWGQGLGTEAIRLLAAFGLEQEHADGVFGCDIADYNARSLRAFMKAGFRLDASYPEPPGRKARTVHDVVLTREG